MPAYPSAIESDRDLSRTQPPRPPLVINVGVTGHRLDPHKRVTPDFDAITRVIGQVLEIIRNTVSGIASTHAELFERPEGSAQPAPYHARLLTALAEGADQWVTSAAIDLRYEIRAVLPFFRDVYKADFEGTALENYNALLGKAGSILELDGTRDHQRGPASYEAAGRAIIQQADLLIAVWDGKEEQGRGGTGQMVHEALRSGVPVIWIKWGTQSEDLESASDSRWQLIQRPEDKESDARHLSVLIANILLPPDLNAKLVRPHDEPLREHYYVETQPGWSFLRGFWGFFLACFLFKRPSWSCTVPDAETATQQDWHEQWTKAPSGLTGDVMRAADELYLPHYAWSNQLSMHYAGLYRSSFVLLYLFGTLAVLFGLLGFLPLAPHAAPHSGESGESIWGLVFGVIELALLGMIMAVTVMGRRGRWHQRWIEYRTLAERLRLSRLGTLLGGWRQQTTIPGHLSGYGDPINTWVYWHHRAVERMACLPGVPMDRFRLRTIQYAWQSILAEKQIEYHERNFKRLHTLDHRLHLLGNGFFIVSAISCVLHLGLETAHLLSPFASGLMIGLNAFLPACGAATAAIRSQGEFHRVARRSEAMSAQLNDLRQQLSFVSTQEAELHSQEMRRSIEHIAQLMLNETLDWHIVFQDRPLVLPA